MVKFRATQTSFFILFGLMIVLTGCKKETAPADIVEENSYKSEEVSFESDGLTLEGTLFLPTSRSITPAIIIVNGSGPVDRDGLYAPNPTLVPPIYKNWANWLALREIAVLRYDKRFLTHTHLNPLALSQEDQITDIVSAIDYLKTRAEIDTTKIMIVAHSEGGSIAPIAMQRRGFVAGVAIISATSFAVDTLLIEQLKANPDNPQSLITQIEAAFEAIRNNQFPAGGQILGAGEAYWREWIEYSENADSIVINLSKPILVLQGSLDENFPGLTLQKNIDKWGNIANQSNNINFKVHEGVTHLILDNQQEMATRILDDVESFIKQN